MALQLPLIESRSEVDRPRPLPTRTGPGAGRRKGRRSSAGLASGVEVDSLKAAAGGATPVRPHRTFAVVADRPGVLIEVPATDWRIDDHTKAVGMAGIAAAREALAEAVRRTPEREGGRTAA